MESEYLKETYDAPEDKQTTIEVSWKQRVAGIALIVIMTAAWTFEAEAAQAIASGFHTKAHPYNKPVMLGYFIRAVKTLLIPLWAIVFCLRQVFTKGQQKQTQPKPTNVGKVLLWTALFASLNMVIDSAYYYSLARTSVSANTAISSAEPIFVFVLSILILNEEIYLLKVASVAFSIGAICVISYFGSQGGENGIAGTPYGYGLCVLAVVVQSLSDTLYGKAFIREGVHPEQALLYVGLIGLMSVVTQWPILIVLHITGVETLSIPPTTAIIGWAFTATFHLISALTWYLAIQITSPLFVAIGSTLAIPATILADWVIHDYLVPWPAFIGVGVLIISVAMYYAAEILIAVKGKKLKEELESLDETTKLLDDKGSDLILSV